MQTKFNNKDGSLTRYAFACGYVERAEAHDLRVDLWLEGCWHVRAHEFNGRGRLLWECFENLTDARKFFKQTVKQYI